MKSSSPPFATAISVFTKDSPNLDFLRAVAVLCVFGRHIVSEYGDPKGMLFQPQALGIFGVMAFFVHTSLVLMLSLERQFKGSPNVATTYVSFLVRRAFRVYPLSAVVVVVAWFLLPPAMSHVQHLLASGDYNVATFLANLTLTNNLNGRPYVIGTLWTLPLELQMYLFLPAMFLFARRATPKTLLALWPVVALFSFLCRYTKLEPYAPQVLGYVPCFYSGILAYRLGNRGKAILPFWFLPAILLILIEVYMTLYGRFKAETPLGWFVCLTLGLTLPHLRPLTVSWIETASKAVAKYSYGIYLTHTFGIYLAYYALPIGPAPVRILVAAGLTALFSVAAFHLIEAPFINLGARVARAFEHRRRLLLDETPAP